LDSYQIDKIPENLLFLQHQTITSIAKLDITDAQATSSALSYFVKKGTKGMPSF